MKIPALIGFAAILAVGQSVPHGPRRAITPSSIAAHVIKIEHATITEPAFTVEDYPTCIKPFQDLPDSKAKEKILEDAEKLCKQKSELGISPGYHPATTGPGFMVTFETSKARYVVSTPGKCTQVVDRQCGGEWAPDVVVGHTYGFSPPSAGDMRIILTDQLKDVKLIGHLESVVEKKRE